MADYDGSDCGSGYDSDDYDVEEAEYSDDEGGARTAYRRARRTAAIVPPPAPPPPPPPAPIYYAPVGAPIGVLLLAGAQEGAQEEAPWLWEMRRPRHGWPCRMLDSRVGSGAYTR
jgi:hypothetical protein